MKSNLVQIFFYCLLGINILLTTIFLCKSKAKRKKNDKIKKDKNLIVSLISGRNPTDYLDRIKTKASEIQRQILQLSNVLTIPIDRQFVFQKFYIKNKLHIKYLRMLSSPDSLKRKKAAVFLREIPLHSVKKALIHALGKEKKDSVRLFLCASLIQQKDPSVIPSIIDQLTLVQESYRIRIQSLLSEWSEALSLFFPELKDRKEKEIQLLLLELAESKPDKRMEEYTKNLFKTASPEISANAFKVLVKKYPGSVDLKKSIGHNNKDIRKMAIHALAQQGTQENLPIILLLLKTESLREEAIKALELLLTKSPLLLSTLMERYSVEENKEVRSGILFVLSERIEFFLSRMDLSISKEIDSFLKEIYQSGQITGMISFLRKNHNISIENKILDAIRPIIDENKEAKTEFYEYLPQRIIQKLGITLTETNNNEKVTQKNLKKRVILIILLVIVLGLIPVLYFFFGTKNLVNPFNLKAFLIFFDLSFGFYSITINTIYLIVLTLSAIGIHRQNEAWKLKTHSLLFKKNMLPSMSIIAPGFNEEATIIESVNSLLSLNYPIFEVIIVNDGSRDETLQRLIEYFELERSRAIPIGNLKTKRIRGVYQSRKIKNLKVIDKRNGGKADSLNAGINFAKGDFFASIDADSLLEETALLKLMSAVLDIEEEPAALGGNILPVNGCRVKKGYMLSRNIPKNRLARVQTIEYIRSFLSGRIGWATIKGLLIISGAFGVFNRSRVLEFNGYLTSEEVYKKDTVGEDMEIVVRLSKRLADKKIPSRVIYQFNANCWTEIPESWKILVKQRDRWQRGLIDIIIFHFNMMLNPRYKTKGLVSFPYFVLFEIMGPWLEVQGYLLFLTTIVFGFLTPNIFFFLFSSSILFGMIISISSIILSNKEIQSFSTKEQIILLLYAIIENLGIRQLISFIRLKGFISALFNKTAWGSMKRKGNLPVEAENTDEITVEHQNLDDKIIDNTNLKD